MSLQPRVLLRRPPLVHRGRALAMAEPQVEEGIVTPIATAMPPPAPTSRMEGSVFTGRWVDVNKPMRPQASLGTVARAAWGTIRTYARDRQYNATDLSHECLKLMEGLDRGDFRWEFLTPWRKEPLTARDKELWDPEASLWDHLSYLVFFFAYAIANNATLRQLAILGSTFEIFAFLFDDKGPERAEIVPITYETLFIVINGYYALRAYLAEQPVDLEDIERRVYEACFQPTGLSPRQFIKLLEFAEWHVSVDGELLCEQGQPVMDLFVPISGNFSIGSGSGNFSIGLFNLVGEVSLLDNLQSEGGRYHRCAQFQPCGQSN
ncbi:hypothetical protein T492DRAFT_860683 [Pavlovales sp. CCMP2436]|nr:hypothetical protein T492DRAFT_860683 [Pavlovales sp. CCMP2436]